MMIAAKKKMGEESHFPWTNVALWSAVAVIGISVIYILAFEPKWRNIAPSPNELDNRIVVVAPVQQGNAPPRDFYSLPCTRLIALRRLVAQYTKSQKIIGEIYTLADGGGWYVAKEWHEASVSLANAQKNDSMAGKDKAPFVVSDPASWPPFAHYQSADGDSGNIVVSQFQISGTPKRASTLSIEKRVCD